MSILIISYIRLITRQNNAILSYYINFMRTSHLILTSILPHFVNTNLTYVVINCNNSTVKIIAIKSVSVGAFKI